MILAGYTRADVGGLWGAGVVTRKQILVAETQHFIFRLPWRVVSGLALGLPWQTPDNSSRRSQCSGFDERIQHHQYSGWRVGPTNGTGSTGGSGQYLSGLVDTFDRHVTLLRLVVPGLANALTCLCLKADIKQAFASVELDDCAALVLAQCVA